MSLYKATHAGVVFYIETENMLQAIQLWREKFPECAPDGPGSITFVHNEPVIRDGDDQVERCEGCRARATTHDSEGVPLCAGCMAELRAETAAAGRGGS